MTRGGVIGLIGIAALAAAASAIAQAPAQAPAPDTLTYRAPAADSKPRRVAGNMRGAIETAPSVIVLAPDHLALTVSERPTLLWFLSAPTAARIEIALVDPRRSAPLIEAAVAGERAGIHAFRFDATPVRLEPGVAYEWSIAVVVDPAQRSRDVVTSGAIMRVEPPAALRESLAAAPPERRAALLAGDGIWYDALATLSDAIGTRPDDARLRAQRIAILEQAGLGEAAAFERRP